MTLNAPSTHLNKENQELLAKRIWQLRILPENVFPMQKLAFIYGDKVAFLFPEESLVKTIQHKGIAHIFTSMFDALFALGKPVENVIIENIRNGEVKYWRDDEKNHHVPKRELNELILKL